MGKTKGKAIDVETMNDARVARNWSVLDLARIAGIGTGTASNACNGKPISAETMRRIAHALQAHPPDEAVRALLGGTIDDLPKTGAA